MVNLYKKMPVDDQMELFEESITVLHDRMEAANNKAAKKRLSVVDNNRMTASLRHKRNNSDQAVLNQISEGQ